MKIEGREMSKTLLIDRLRAAYALGTAGADNENYQCCITLADAREAADRIAHLERIIAANADLQSRLDKALRASRHDAEALRREQLRFDATYGDLQSRLDKAEQELAALREKVLQILGQMEMASVCNAITTFRRLCDEMSEAARHD